MAALHARRAPGAGLARAFEASCGGLAGIVGITFVLHEHSAVASISGCHPGDTGNTILCVAGIAETTSTALDPFRSLAGVTVALGIFLAIGVGALLHSRRLAGPAQTILYTATAAAGLLGAFAIPAYGFGYLPSVALAVGACIASWDVQRSTLASRGASGNAGVP